MVLPRRLARFNRVVTNRITRPFAGALPGFGVVTHRGRGSGRLYRTPVNVFRTRDGYVVPLTYGPDADWVRNVVAAGGCDLRTRGGSVRLTEPRVVRDEARRAMPPGVRDVLNLVDVGHFLFLTRE
ncbi:nitroreductase family deazaflavin-dependent oxidoreductase [Qaidamihabitans albus]|uniref:nitroreductase family deazaflavin-dependent oxidoreductase n=1 Tax=Qaidamihabitans albus TaxID=2795733 RepID=UPI0018F13349|nr:nitroreductase family deazaflavin-dependent oxidoreductase [Qaidamihabitans albus]